MNVLRKLVFIFLFSVLVKNSFSQDQYYVYIQSQNHQSFYARVGSSTFTSSGNGYLLLPGLVKNTYELIIGFPGQKISEWRFNCTVDNADLGFILKDKGTGGVQLVHLDQKGALAGTVVEQQKEVKAETVPLTGVISNDPFSTMLASVVNDPSIRQQLVIVDKKLAPVNNDAVESSIAGVPAAPVIVNRDNSKPGETVAPVTIVKEDVKTTKEEVVKKGDKAIVVASTQKSAVVPEETKTVLVEPEIKKTETVAVKEVAKTKAAQTEKQSQKGVVQKDDKAIVAASTQKPGVVPEETKTVIAEPEIKKTEPFVVREIITKRDGAETRQEPDATAKIDTNSSEEVKYLPFVIKPADKKTTPPVIKNEDKPKRTEKNKAVKAGAEIPAGDSAIVTQKEKSAPDGKKAVISSVKKTLERKSRDGVDLIYIDEDVNGAKDTIRIFIPALK